MDKKRIILLLDGTWNDMDFGTTDTNVVRLLRIISRSLRKAGDEQVPPQKLVSGFHTASQMEHLVFYERGVGTGFLESIRGGAFGFGLGVNVRRAYKFLSHAYSPGDEIFIFGFSRGAYTARSLVGYLGSAGLLRCQECTAENEAIAWNYYRTSPNDRLPGVWAGLNAVVNDRDVLRVTAIGVFDTVGALGIPLEPLRRANRERYSFHDVNLSSITQLNLHALAIDEHRMPFEATVWRTPPFKRYTANIEQVWFPGAHGDIGGGYIDEERRAVDGIAALDDLPLRWMLQRIRNAHPDFPADDEFVPAVSGASAVAPQHESRGGFYRAMPLALRCIANRKVTGLGWHQAAVGYDRHADFIHELVHESALIRRRESRGAKTPYEPRNLVTVLPVIQDTYKGVIPVEQGIRVVGSDGVPYDPQVQADSDAVLALLR